jgi:hexokinase
MQTAFLIKHAFEQELQQAVLHKKSSLLFIPHTIPELSHVQDGETFQVIVIGGSVFRKALVKKDKDTLIPGAYEEHAQPIFLSKESFLNYITTQIDPDVQVVGLNFAYPLSPVLTNDKLDGVLISGTKENTFTGLVHEQIGTAIEQAVRENSQRAVTVSVANDAICLLLSGLTMYPKENLVAAIMGTGTNITFFHDGNAINLESANFDKFSPSEECLAIDAKSAAPGTSLFEKETSGGYLYQQFNLLLRKQHSGHPPIASTKELKEIALDGKVPVLSDIAKSLIERSASYLSAQLAGVAAFKKQPITVIMEGSFFWQNTLYKDCVAACLQALSPDFPVTIVHVDNSPVLGGAKLVA